MPATQPEEWFTLEEAARLCRRSPKTIRNLITDYDLPRTRLWIVRNRVRRRVSHVSAATVALLQRMTLHGEAPPGPVSPGPEIISSYPT